MRLRRTIALAVFPVGIDEQDLALPVLRLARNKVRAVVDALAQDGLRFLRGLV